MPKRKLLASIAALALVAALAGGYTIPNNATTQGKLVVADSIRVGKTSIFNGAITGKKATYSDSVSAVVSYRIEGGSNSFGIRIGDGTIAPVAANGTLSMYSTGTGPMYFITNGDIRGQWTAAGDFVVNYKATIGDSLRANKGLYVGGQFVNKILRASATLNFDLTSLTTEDKTVTVAGAVDGDEVFVGAPNGSITTTVQYTGWVSAANTVTVRARTLATGENPASGTFKVTVFQ